MLLMKTSSVITKSFCLLLLLLFLISLLWSTNHRTENCLPSNLCVMMLLTGNCYWQITVEIKKVKKKTMKLHKVWLLKTAVLAFFWKTTKEKAKHSLILIQKLLVNDEKWKDKKQFQIDCWKQRTILAKENWTQSKT